MVSENVRVVRHNDLSDTDLRGLADLFDAEYADEYGRWSPDAPYGYAPADVHALVFDGADVVAHVGFQTRVIAVGDSMVTAGGTGGVLVREQNRGRGYARLAMVAAQGAMLAGPAVARRRYQSQRQTFSSREGERRGPTLQTHPGTYSCRTLPSVASAM